MTLPAGSSPRAWGTPPQHAGRAKLHRFIPTRVGNTPKVHGRPPGITVHPHARGEHLSTCFRSGRCCRGSSPRAWGTHRATRGDVVRTRFIPTRVGNTNQEVIWPTRVGNTWSESATSPVHPHARGEHLGAMAAATVGRPFRGSSPRAWGTRRASRFIRWASFLISVHPHARGEHLKPRVRDSRKIGSSPRAWGTQAGRCSSCGAVGSSPRAWGTPKPRSPGGVRRFIPTRVGEHARLQRSHRARYGSSPRAWGTQ